MTFSSSRKPWPDGTIFSFPRFGRIGLCWTVCEGSKRSTVLHTEETRLVFTQCCSHMEVAVGIYMIQGLFGLWKAELPCILVVQAPKFAFVRLVMVKLQLYPY